MQLRPGLNERLFKVIKFKTMTDAKDEKGNHLPDRERITKVGKIVRKTSLDELPQLFNIIMGKMSFIGPRPLLVKYLPYYTEWERKRHAVRPGLTGLAQINGRNTILWEDRIRFDIEYVNNMSFKQDVKIIFLTISKVLKGSDVTVVPADQGRAPLHIRRNPKHKHLYDKNGYYKK